MELSRLVKFLLIFFVITIPTLIIIPFLPLNPNRGETILNKYHLIDRFPTLSFNGSIVDIQSTVDDPESLFIVDQVGRILKISNISSQPFIEIFLDITDRVKSGGELGLLGLTFHPNFKSNGYFFVDYTTENPLKTVISRFQVSSISVVEDSEEIFLEIEQPYSNHNAGQIVFDEEGYLYITVGDGGLANDPDNNGQDRSTLLGSILRIDVDRPSQNTRYSIPETNPFWANNQGFREEIFAYGLRNPWRMTIDPVTGYIIAADVGQNQFEEIDLIEVGKNYGWNEMEGFHCLRSGCDSNGLELPLWEYDHSKGISITGGYVYRGMQLTNLFGQYIFADFGSGRIWAMNISNLSEITVDLLLKDNVSISTFGQGVDGELFIGTIQGQVLSIVKN